MNANYYYSLHMFAGCGRGKNTFNEDIIEIIIRRLNIVQTNP